jgi:ATP-dependent exoDNAse (exonuclease V) beta subunit
MEIYDPLEVQTLENEINSIYQTLQNSPNGQKILSAREYKNEINLTMQIGEDFLTGTLDRLQKNHDDQWQIIDYKTNQISAGQLENAGNEYRIQIETYALLLSRLYPEQQEYSIALYFLNVDEFFERSFSQEDIGKIERRFLDLINQIKTKFPVEN